MIVSKIEQFNTKIEVTYISERYVILLSILISCYLSWSLGKYLDYDIGDYGKYEFRVTEEKLRFNIYDDYFKIVIINMDNYIDKCYNGLNLSDRFFEFLSATKIDKT